MDLLYILGFYVIGFIVNLLLLIKFGKRIGYDYDQPKTYEDMDDFESNASAYLSFSLIWPLFISVTLLALGAKFVIELTQKLIDKEKEQ